VIPSDLPFPLPTFSLRDAGKLFQGCVETVSPNTRAPPPTFLLIISVWASCLRPVFSLVKPIFLPRLCTFPPTIVKILFHQSGENAAVRPRRPPHPHPPPPPPTPPHPPPHPPPPPLDYRALLSRTFFFPRDSKSETSS